MPINVLIADDHAIVRFGLRKILETQHDIIVTGEATDGREAIALSGERPCDVIVMDIAMPGINGIEATRTICSNLRRVKVVILSMHDNSEHVYRAFQAGADGYLLKGVAGDEIITAIRAVMKGELYLGKGVEEPSPPGQSQLKSPLESLSPREREVLQLVVEGKSGAEIASALSLAASTPDVYRSRIMRKLGIKNNASLVKFAIQHGITSLE
jgi:DNA-binding NarL/FixJ family response regulator